MDRNFSLFFIPIYEGICSVLYHIIRTHTHIHTHTLYVLYIVILVYIHSQTTDPILRTYAFIISDLSTIYTCHNNLRLTYRIVKDFSSKIFFTIIYTAFSAVNQWFNHLVFFPSLPLPFCMYNVHNLRMYSTKILYQKRKRKGFLLPFSWHGGSFLLIYIGVQVE